MRLPPESSRRPRCPTLKPPRRGNQHPGPAAPFDEDVTLSRRRRTRSGSDRKVLASAGFVRAD
ncbi:Hypothetical predicted protein [Podarcis lilfordi]|uniref:Uncharacterized protein n=1 Tax=Podarcis lilfordi TaxID=74358 RepID=A0AA35L702_9SAUR|nr:Hypothetical predicted protein [Podarcis lilfordi]